MKYKTLITYSLLFVNTCVWAQQGKPFPEMAAKTLAGKEIKLPDHLKGKHSIISLIYSQKTNKALETWLQPLYNTFKVKNPLDPEPYDVHLKIVLMLSGIKNLASDVIEKKIKSSVDPSFYHDIIIYQGSIKSYLDALDFGKKDEPYFCVIDKSGIISYSTTGMYTPAKLEEIESKVQE